MRRTRHWWQRLNEDERSELYALECANSSWTKEKYPKFACNHCNIPQGHFGLCLKCKSRLDQLVAKADEATLRNT